MTSRAVEIFKQIAIPIISLGISLVFWFLPYWGTAPVSFSSSDRLLLSLLSFVAITLVRIAWLDAVNVKQQRLDNETWEILHIVDSDMHNSRKYYTDVVSMRYGKNDVFVKQCIKKIRQLTEDIRIAAQNMDLRVEKEHLFTVKDVLDIYKDDDERIWRYSWPIDLSRELFEHDAWRQYFEETALMLRKRQLKEIHILLILNDRAALDNPRIKKLLDYFKTNRKNVCRYTFEERFKSICGQHGIPDKNWIDFGIYAKKLLFIADADASANGLFTKSAPLIEKYCNIFDFAWEKGHTYANPSQCETHVTLDELFSFDEKQFREEEQKDHK